MNFHSKPNSFVSHVNLKVADLNHSQTFYQKVLGFKVLEQTETTVKFTADGETSILSIEQLQSPVAKQGKTTGLYHFALLLPNRSDLANIVHHFTESGVEFGASDHLVSEALYLSDLDGNGIEIYIDRAASEWNWQNDEVVMAVDPLNFPDLLTERTEKAWQGMPAGTIMGHIHLHVSELVKTEAFYCQGLGFEVVSRFGNQALFIATGKYHHQIALNTWNGVGAPAPDVNSVGLGSFTIALPSEEVRQNVIERLEDLGASVTKENNTFVTIDPSGNRIYLSI